MEWKCLSPGTGLTGQCPLTMRLSDAGLNQVNEGAFIPIIDSPPPWLTEDTTAIARTDC